MSFRRAASVLTIIAMLASLVSALASFAAAPAEASASSKRARAHQVQHAQVHHGHAHRGNVYRANMRSGYGRYAGAAYGSGRIRGRVTMMRRPSRFAPLVGDRAGGYGFYPLPLGVRIAAWRYRQRRAFEARRDIGIAVASTAVYSNWAFPYNYGGVGFGNHHGVFNPVDGVGTPFFAGYYGDGGGDDDDPPPFVGAYDH